MLMRMLPRIFNAINEFRKIIPQEEEDEKEEEEPCCVQRRDEGDIIFLSLSLLKAWDVANCHVKC